MNRYLDCLPLRIIKIQTPQNNQKTHSRIFNYCFKNLVVDQLLLPADIRTRNYFIPGEI